ncbi:BAI1-associated protein 3-like [Paramacrobiotus metropolitanus]|uniref:BAI1-associated protein 3-like n=1 Tax=Paramacrobiotus metropolitanus TaxID=2943436 RepID=UPI002445FC19|nr:BAI1-associated protein 3-like [Paramacrobiotus metropolitanus]
MFMGRRRSSVFSSSSGVNSPEIAMRIRDNIGDDFFERFSGLSSRALEYRNRADKEAEKEQSLPFKLPGSTMNSSNAGSRRRSVTNVEDDLEELYVEVLYTIKHKIGQTDPYQHLAYNDELLDYAQAAFGIDSARHYRLFSKANQEKPPKVVLNVAVIEGRDLEAKDPNGFSDPYCMLGLIGNRSRRQVEALQSTPSSETFPEDVKEARSKKSSMYRHNRTKSRRDYNSDILEQLPAKFIRTTTVKKATLNPQWNETFQLPVDDPSEDILHLDIFDHDEEYEVMDAVKNVKNVQGIKGLNRYFKQIAQSARKSAADNVDDFLGCVDIRVLDIPSIGIDKVFNLYSRTTNKSRVQGSLRLRLNLTTREDKNQTNNLSDFLQHKDIITAFMKHEVKKFKTSIEWNGELNELAETILHQHAIQGNLTDLQLAACTWIALIDIHVHVVRLDYLVLFQALKHLDSLWVANGLGLDAEEITAECVGNFKDYALSCLEKEWYHFPMNRTIAQRQMESLLKCLRLLFECKFFKRFFPLDDSMNSVVTAAIKIAAIDYYHSIREKFRYDRDDDGSKGMESFSYTLIAMNYDLRRSFRTADKLFANFKIKYLAITMMELDKLVYGDFERFAFLKQMPDFSDVLNNRDPYAILKDDFFTAPGKEEPNAEIFVLYMALNDFIYLRKHLSEEDKLMHKWKEYNTPFIPFVLQWLSYAKVAAKRKMKSWVENDKISRAESIIRYSTSVIEANGMLTSIVHFIKDLKWPDPEQNCILMCKLISDIAEDVAYFSEITYRAFKDSGWLEHELLEVNDDLCIAVNNLETIRCHFMDFPEQLGWADMTKSLRDTGDPVLIKFANDCDGVLTQALFNGKKMLTERITKALEKLIKKMNTEISQHLAKLICPPMVSVESLTSPVVDFMDSILANLYSIMLKANFLRTLELLWLNILDQIMALTFANRTKEPACFINLYQSLSIFIEYFHAGDKGLPSDVIESERYHSVKRKVFYYQLSPQELIDSFVLEAVNIQSAMTKTPYGTLTIRIHYEKKSGKVMLEVIHARDVIPMDTNGLSDPFVIIRFLPMRIFSNVPLAKTSVVKKSLDPQWDERFEFAIPIDKCIKDCSAIHFALMDHDVMFQDELAGEGFLQLCKIPGLKGEQTKNFSGLREITMPLLHPKMMTSGILADIIEVLKCREQQKEGLDFLNVLFIE